MSSPNLLVGQTFQQLKLIRSYNSGSDQRSTLEELSTVHAVYTV